MPSSVMDRRSFSKMEGIHYLRANRKSVRNVYAPGSTFTMGKGIVVKEGKDVLIITTDSYCRMHWIVQRTCKKKESNVK